MGYLLLKVAVKVIRQRYRDRLMLPMLVERWSREQLISVKCVERNDGTWEANNRRNLTEIRLCKQTVGKFTGFIYCDVGTILDTMNTIPDLMRCLGRDYNLFNLLYILHVHVHISNILRMFLQFSAYKPFCKYCKPWFFQKKLEILNLRIFLYIERSDVAFTNMHINLGIANCFQFQYNILVRVMVLCKKMESSESTGSAILYFRRDSFGSVDKVFNRNIHIDSQFLIRDLFRLISRR